MEQKTGGSGVASDSIGKHRRFEDDSFRNRKKKILAAGASFAEVWNDVACSIKLKKKLIRTLLKEIVVNLDDNTDELHFLMHWHGGVHTEVSMQKPLSAVKKYRTSQEDIEIIRKMAVRYRDADIARVLSKLGRTTAKGLRWSESRVASARKKAGISPVKKKTMRTLIFYHRDRL